MSAVTTFPSPTASPPRADPTPVTRPATATPPPVAGMADPTPVGFALFAFALAMYGIRFISVSSTTLAAGPTTIALDYAILIGAIAEMVAGLLAVIRGLAYPGYVTLIFGVWLFGLALLLIIGTTNKAFTPDAIAWYLLVLIPPVAIMAVPAIVHRHVPFIIAFAGILALQVLAGLGNHAVFHAIATAKGTKSAPEFSTAVNLIKASAWCAFVSAIAIWWVFAHAVYQATGVLRSKSD